MIFRNDIFSKHGYNVYSQHGEDGIIDCIRSLIGKENLNYKCCEFGAWDGVHFSNTFNLIKNKSYDAILIESNKKKFKQLRQNIPAKNIIKLNQKVGFEKSSNLDFILREHGYPIDIDFVSIDIDGNDYHIFDDLKEFIPKIICIEYNTTMSNSLLFVQKKDQNISHGSSIRSLVNLALKKKYHLVTCTPTNVFFIHENYKQKVIGDGNISIDHVRKERLVEAFVGYDGTIFFSRKIILQWHKLTFNKINVFPKILLGYSGSYNFFQKIIFYFYLFKFNPKKYIKNFRYYFKKLFEKEKY